MSAQLPGAVRMIDVDRPAAAIADVARYSWTRLFVTDRGALVGSVDIGNMYGPISATRLRDAVANGLAYPLLKRAVERQLGVTADPALPPNVSVSVVIPTCNRPDDLRRCLAALEEQRGERPMQVIVVDNRPGTGSPSRAVVAEFSGVILLEEPKPGLSYARNAGFAAATGDICIAIDDDVTVPHGWLERLVAPFARPEVMAVTGNVLPLELETTSQCRFESYGGLGKGFTAFDVNGQWFRDMRGAVPTWNIGATANAAFRSSVFSDPAIGMLDEALGAGMPTGCSEDTYLFYKILKANHTIAYEPTAWVWHRHRRDERALRHQIYCYSKGHVAYHLTTLLRDGDRRALLRLAYGLPKTYLRRAWQRVRRRSDYPMSLIFVELAGTLAGPFALWQARRRVGRLGPGARVNRDHAVSLESPFPQTPAA